MPSQPHHAVQAVHARGAAVLSHARGTGTGAFWSRWFAKPHDQVFASEVRGFAAALNKLLDVPPTMIARGELAGIGTLVDQVVKRVEAAIDEASDPTAEATTSLAPAIYSIRTRYETLYKRGATKAE